MTFDPTTARPELPFDPTTARPEGQPSPREVLGVAVKTDPAQASEAARLAKRYPAPNDVLLRNLTDAKLQAAVDDADGVLNTDVPALRRKMTDVPFAQQAHRDTNVLASIESALRQTGRSAKSGVYGADRGAAGMFQAVSEFVAPVLDVLETDPFTQPNDWRTAIGGNPLRRLAEGFAAIGRADLATQKSLRPQGEQGVVASGFYSGIESLTQNALMLPAAFVPGGQGVALTGMAGMTGGQSYQDAREKGLGMAQALPFAASQAAIEYATEKIPLGRLLGDVKAGTPIMQTILRQIGAEIPGEQVATILQDLNEWAVLNPDKPFTSYLEERPSAAAQTLVATIVGAGGNIVIAQGLEKVATLAAGRDAQAQKSDADLQRFERALAAAANSELRTNNPETFAEFVNEAATESGAPTAVYVDARTLTDALNQAGITDEQLAQLMPSVPAQIAEAFEAGGTVEIPIGEALAAAPGTPLEQVLLQNARMEPDGLSRLEVDEAAKQAETLVKEEADRVMQSAQQRAESEAQADQIKATITEQLNAAGRFRPEANQTYATMVGAFYATLAQRTGMTPADLYARYPLRVTGEMQTAGALEQVGTPAFNDWFGDSKVVDAEGKPLVVYHGTTKDFDTFESGMFTSRPGVATGFAGGDSFAPTGANVMPVYISMQNPMPWTEAFGKTPEQIKAAGYDGTIQWTRTPGDALRIVVTDPSQIKSATGNNGNYDPTNPSILEQQTRATFSPSQMLIALGPNADYSSFLHETGHFWLEVLADIASQPNAPQQIVDDFNTTLAWFGVEPGAWAGMSLDQKRPHHERWAESVEQYFFEGKAPSVELRGVFDRFRTWLTAVYKSLKQFLATRTSTPGGMAGRGELGQGAPEERDLMVTHNLTAANLLHAVKMGGIPVPSLAVTKKDTPLTGFGEITLIGDSNLADPKGYAGTKVYGADIYSPRYPSVTFEFTPNMRKRGDAALQEGMAATGENYFDWSEVERDGPREVERRSSFLWKFLTDKGVTPDVRRTEVKPLPPELAAFAAGKLDRFDLVKDEAFIAAAWKMRRDFLLLRNEGNEAETDAELAEEKARVAERGKFYYANELAGQIENYRRDARDNGKVDSSATRYALQKQVRDLNLSDELEVAAKTFVQDLAPNERIFQGFTPSGNRKYVPHTLENVVKILKKELRGGESFNYGVGSLRAKFTPEFKSLAAIKKAKDRLVSAEQFEPVKKEVDDELAAIATDLGLSLDQTIEVFEDAPKVGVEKAISRALTDYRSDAEATDEVKLRVAQFLTRLRNLPTAYFEAKVLREVDLSEFKAAVVPEGTDPQVLAALTRAGITDVRTYAKGDEKDRAATIGEFDSLFFQRDATAGPLGLSDEVRAVMDRLLATDEQIAEMERVRQYGLLFKSPEEAGMTPELWAQYTSDDEKAHAAALAELSKRSLRDLGIVMRKRMRALRDVQRDMAEKRKAVREEAAAIIDNTPLEKARRAMKEAAQPAPALKAALKEWKDARAQALTDATEQVKVELLAANPDVKGIEKGQLLAKNKREMANEAERRALQWEKQNPKPRAPVSDVDMAAIADTYGFPSVDEMQRELVSGFTRTESVEGLTDQMMLERYGDLTTARGMERAADEAVHNENRARVLAAEMVAITAANNARFATPAGRTVNAMVQAAKLFAARVADSKKIKDLKPQQHTAAETRAARAAEKALAAGKTEDVIRAKRDQVLQFHTARAVNEARTEAVKIEAFLKKIATAKDDVAGKTRDLDVVKAAQQIVAAYGIGQAKGKTAAEYMEAVKQYDPAMAAALEPSITATLANAKPFNELTMDEARALHEELQALWHLAKRSRQMEVDGKLLDLEEVTDDLKARLVAIGIPDSMPGDTSAITPAEQRALKLKHYLATARRVESWAQGMDGSEKIGAFRRYVWQPVKEAADAYRVDKAKYLKQFRELLRAIEPTLTKRQIAAPELGYVFGKDTDGVAMAEILHALLHTGNESNKRKLLLGRKWATENADGTLDTGRWDAFVQRLAAEGVLQPAHMDFVQGVWDMLEGMKPQAQKTHRDVFGRYFKEVTADAFTDPFGVQRRGGYVPAMADSRIVSDAATRKLMEDENASMQFAFPSTAKGFTKARVDYNRPLLLDLRSLSQHIDKVLLFSHMESPVRDVRRALTAKGVAYGLNRIDPAAFDKVLTPWLNRAAKQLVAAPVPNSWQGWRAWTVIRNRAGMAAMFGNLANAVQQFAGFSLAAVKVKPSRLAAATAQYIAAPRATAEMVASKSAYMDQRMANEVANMSDTINDILINPGVYEKSQRFLQKHAYFLQSAIDNVMGPIVWTGAYNQALEQGAEERDAIRLADSAVRETQGATAPEDISAFEEGTPFSRIFTQFAGYFNMQANLLGTEFQNIGRELGLRKGLGRGLYVLMFGFMVNAWVAEAIMQAFKGGPDDEDKDGEYWDDWLAQVFGWSLLRNTTAMVPVFGQAANSAVNSLNTKPYDDRIASSPAISMLESAVRAHKSVYQAVVEDGKPSKAIRDVGTAVAVFLGLPITPLTKTAGYLADVDAGKVAPTSTADAVRGAVTGSASPESKSR